MNDECRTRRAQGGFHENEDRTGKIRPILELLLAAHGAHRVTTNEGYCAALPHPNALYSAIASRYDAVSASATSRLIENSARWFSNTAR